MDAYEGLETVIAVADEVAFWSDYWTNQTAGRKGSREDATRTRKAKARDLGRRQARAAKFAAYEA